VSSRLIVNADDYGLSPGVSRGILEAHRRGIVTSTTVMVNRPGIEEQISDALACPSLGIGLHFVFTTGQPVLPQSSIPGLVDEDGRFLDQHSVWAVADDIPVDQLRAELEAQLARFISLAGRLPDHIDCHHFVHVYPPFFQAYVDLAAEARLPLRIPFPLEVRRDHAVRVLPYLEGFPQNMVQDMVVANSALVLGRALAHPDHFISTFFGREMLTPGNLMRLLWALPEGTTELMCHPGYCDEGLAPCSYWRERETELAILTSRVVQNQVDALGVELVTFGSLSHAAQD
jgi:predicted glycoside hydrolase/deacetylase ChbG (UPF0249 family)